MSYKSFIAIFSLIKQHISLTFLNKILKPFHMIIYFPVSMDKHNTNFDLQMERY